MPELPMLSNLSEHPCFCEEAHFIFGRIHLPVAPECNLQCAYCNRDFDCPNESRPGVSSGVLTPIQALERVRSELSRETQLKVAGIAGPGEPLYNPETFETLRLLRGQFPQLNLCLSTNGLLLSDKLEELLECRLNTLTVTVNTLRQQHAEIIYQRISYQGRTLPISEGCNMLLEAQKEGLSKAVKAGLAVKLNMVLIPGVNDDEVAEIANWASSQGVVIMNLMPLIPQAAFHALPRPSGEKMQALRNVAGHFIPQFTLCKQCRADACGIPGLPDKS